MITHSMAVGMNASWKHLKNCDEQTIGKASKGSKIRIEAAFTMFIFTPCILVWVE